MTTKRILTIIGALLVLLFLILGGVWLIGRNKAVKVGQTPLTFRQFLGLGGNAAPANTAGGTTSSVFTTPSNGTGTSTSNGAGADQGINAGNSSTGSTDNTQTSQFTNTSLSPADNSSLNGNGGLGNNGGINSNGALGSNGSIGTSGNIGNVGTLGSNGGISLGGTSTSGSTTGTSGNPTGTTTGTAGLSNCTTADTTITFTPAEIQQLNALQAQYNAISANLASDSDVATELSTYTAEKLEEAKIAEMQTFCQANTPLLTDPELQRHVPTPFWHNASQDSQTFTGGNTVPTSVSANPTDGEPFLERLLRINLW